MIDDIAVDRLSGHRVIIAPDRQDRPNLPDDGCPFCVGGREAPEPYDVRWFANRWPSLPDGRAEVVLFSPDHAASLGTLGTKGIRRVIDVWADRTVELGARDDVAYVLVFENRGERIGATIDHPHGQIYAFGDVPPVPAGELERAASGPCELCVQAGDVADGDDRIVASCGSWRAWIPAASAHPYGIVCAPATHVASLADVDPDSRDDFARLLGAVLGGLDAHFDEQTPYMLWIHQRPTDDRPWPQAHVHAEIVPLRRAPGVDRFVAGAELGSGVYINSVPAHTAAANLRSAIGAVGR